MSKLIFSVVVILTVFTVNSSSKTWIIKATNYSFEPKSLTVAVGDTIKFEWEKGRHATSSTKVPEGAKSWDVDLDSSNPTFIYVITKAGEYNYICSPHESDDMTGTITAK